MARGDTVAPDAVNSRLPCWQRPRPSHAGTKKPSPRGAGAVTASRQQTVSTRTFWWSRETT